MLKKTLLMILMFCLSFELPVDPSSFKMISDDLLNGEGLFKTQSLGGFSTDPHHTTSFLIVNSTNVLK